ncbi:hypothetical protein FP828_03535, partial [bacterium]|nr:hypothetical protein [bacterium]
MADKKNPPSPFGGGMKPPSFGAPQNKPPGFAKPLAGIKTGERDASPQSQPARENDSSGPLITSFSGAQNYEVSLKAKIEQAKKTLEDSRAKKKEIVEKRELYWMGVLKEKEKEAESLNKEMKGTLENMEISQAEKETALRNALQQFEGRLMSVSRELEDEKKKSYSAMQKAREESEASLKVEMALKEIVSSKDYEDKLQSLHSARENLLKDMIRQKDNFNREKSALQEQLGLLSEQIANQREIISRKESAEKFFEVQKEKDIEAARSEAKTRLEDLINQVKSREESVRLKENEFRIQEFANKQKLDTFSDELRKKESALSGLRDTAARLERELAYARNALDEGNSKFVKEIEWLKKHFEEERAAWSDRFDKESHLRKDIASSYTDIVKERDNASRALAIERAGVEDIASRLAEKEKDLANLKSAFERENSDIKNIYESGLERITSARDVLADEAAEAETEIKRLSCEKNKLEEELSSAVKQLREKETNEKSLANKMEKLFSDRNSFEKKLEEQRLLFEDEKKRLYLTITQLNTEKENSGKEKYENRNQINGLNEEILRKEQEIKLAEKTFRVKSAEYSLEKENLEKEIKKLEAEKEIAAKERFVYEAARSELEAKLRNQALGMKNADAARSEAKGVINDLNARLSESKKEQVTFLQREKALEEKIINYESAIEKHRENIVLIKTESEERRGAKDTELEQARLEIEGLNGKLNGFLEEKNKLAAKFGAISEELSAMTKQRDTFFNEKNTLSEELSATKTQIEELLSSASLRAAEIQESADEISRLKDKLKDLSSSHSSETVELKNRILEQHKKMENLFSRINEYNVEIEALKAAPRETITEYKQKLLERQNAEAEMRRELEELRVEKERSAEKDGVIKDYDGKIAALAGKLSATESEINKMRESSVRAAEMDAQIVRKDAQLKEASGEIAELRSQLESLEKAKLDDREKFDAEIRTLRDDYNKRLAEVEERTKSFEKTKAELENLETVNKKLSDENLSLRQQKGAVSEDSEKFRKLTSEKEKEIEELKTLSIEAAENIAKAAGFENQLKEAEKEIAHLKETSSSDTSQAREFKDKLRELGEIIEKQKKDISEKMEYIKGKELEFHKILKKKDEDISVLKAQLEIGLEALGGQGEVPNDKRLGELQKINEEIKRKSDDREAMLREEIDKKEKEA